MGVCFAEGGPCIVHIDSPEATPNVLAPPNHKMVSVAVSYDPSFINCSAPSCFLSAASNQSANGQGDGNTTADWQVVDRNNVLLRAERSGSTGDRIYTITIRCSGKSLGGGTVSTTATTTVTVPLDDDN